jgi:formate dehydrogenase iron-sulfur subunit
VEELKAKADARLAQLKSLGETRANIYGYTQAKGLNVFYLLMDKPEVYGLPENPVVDHEKKPITFGSTKVDMLVAGVSALIKFRERVGRK